MPGLYDLRQDFNKLSPVEKMNFIRSYRKRRAEDLSKPATYGKKASAETASITKLKNFGLTSEEIAIAKTLGLKPKDLAILKERANAS